MKEKIIIIGGGLGGLVCGCLLSKAEYEVVVLEKHYRIGGGLHCFKRYGTEFETGIHYVSGFQEGGVLRKLFSYIGVFDRLKFHPMDSNGFDVLKLGDDSEEYNFGIGKENFVRQLAEKFPDEEENLARYIDSLYAICDQFGLYNLSVNDTNVAYFYDEYLMPVENFIKLFIRNSKLCSILAWNNSLYGGERGTTPVYVHALVTKFYIEGATRFAGGSQQLADAMADVIEKSGGQVLCSKDVAKIEIENQMVSRVITSNNEIFEADYYISDLHPSVLLNKIDPSKVQRSYRERLHGLENSYSMFVVYIKLKHRTFKYLNHNLYYHSGSDKVWKSGDYKNPDFPEGFMLSTPPAQKQDDYADKLIINCVMNFEDVKQWNGTYTGKRGKEYRVFKKIMEDKVLAEVEKVYPDIRQSIDKIFSATPLTIRDFTGSKEGSLYGFKKEGDNIVKSQVLPRTKFANLLLTGQNIGLHGIMGVPLNAIITAGELIGFKALVDKINNCK